MDPTDEAESPLSRYVPLLISLGVAITLFLIPLMVIRLGFTPADDAKRHVAKIFSGKTWSEIMVMRPEVTLDHNAGWHAILGAVERITHWNADALLTFSVAGLAMLYLLLPLPFASRVEAWPAALLAIVVASPHYAYRLMLGRPYIFTMAAFMLILHLWRRQDYRPKTPTLIATALLISIAAWIHGGWYLYWVPAVALLFAQRWRAGAIMAGCWLMGSTLAGVYTGHPIHFLTQQFQVLVSCFSFTPVQRMLVTEFLPTDGSFTFVVVLGAVVLARKWRDASVADCLKDPLFMMALMCWTLGLLVRRFWLDWGVLAMLVWLTSELAIWSRRLFSDRAYTRLIAAGVASGALLLSITSDLDSRWTSNLTKEYLSPETPDIAGWLPEPGGIIYSDSMSVFYDTFFENPTAPWRYILGFEATFMPREDLETLRKIQWNFGTPAAYLPWIQKMKPADRLIFKRPLAGKPDLPQLEWHYGATETWIGRLPRGVTAPAL